MLQLVVSKLVVICVNIVDPKRVFELIPLAATSAVASSPLVGWRVPLDGVLGDAVARRLSNGANVGPAVAATEWQWPR